MTIPNAPAPGPAAGPVAEPAAGSARAAAARAAEGARAPTPTPLLDLLLSTDPLQRARLAQSGLALLLMALAVLSLQYFVVVGKARADAVGTWGVLTLGSMLAFFVLIRSGWTSRFRDPTLTVAQMLIALSSAAAAYALMGPGRAAVFPVVMVILMLGLFVASPRQMLWLSLYTLLLFGLAMLLLVLRHPRDYPAEVEFGHFLLLAVNLPAVSLLAGRLARMRQRARTQRSELAQALSRLRENTTRDELTGLVNRRQMQLLMEQEHQRCIRSGQTFCVAVLDIDRFKPVNEAHGYAVGDAVLRAVADEALRHVRVSDVLCRWGSDDLVLLMSDTRSALARGGLERLHQRVAALRILHGTQAVSITLSAGLAEHLAGENVARTLERAQQALQEAKALGRDRVLVAP